MDDHSIKVSDKTYRILRRAAAFSRRTLRSELEVWAEIRTSTPITEIVSAEQRLLDARINTRSDKRNLKAAGCRLIAPRPSAHGMASPRGRVQPRPVRD